MDYSIIGFPRIGIHRELKFATEAYFRSEIDADELKRVVSQQRMEQWTRQRDAGAGFIPSNDFSLYDGMLDTAYMLNAIPRRYADLRLSARRWRSGRTVWKWTYKRRWTAAL